MKKLLSLFLAVVSVLSGCSAPRSSWSADSQPVISSTVYTDATFMERIEQSLGSDFLTYISDDFVFYKGISSACLDDGSGTVLEYDFVSNYKSGDYRTEIYYGRYPLMDKYVIIRMENDHITNVIRFVGRDMSANFGVGGKLDVTADEKLSAGKMYCQRTAVTLNFDFIENTVSVGRNDIGDIGEMLSPLSTSEDGLYTIFDKNPMNMDQTCELRNNITGEMIILDNSYYYNTGFMDNGNLYIKNLDDYKVFDTSGRELYALSKNFPTGLVDENKGIWRKICGVYNDLIHSRIFVVYFDRGSSGNLDYVKDTTLLYDTYRVAVLDENGVRQRIIETGKYAETHNSNYSDVSVRVVNEHTISFYEEYKNVMQFEVFVDLNTEEITLLDYRQWE